MSVQVEVVYTLSTISSLGEAGGLVLLTDINVLGASNILL